MNTSCGIFIKYNDKYLFGHPTNAKYNYLSIPKGGINENESQIECAIRETVEETNINLSEYIHLLNKLGEFKYNSGKKILVAYYIDITNLGINLNNIKCKSFIKESNLPEFDKLIWLSYKEVIDNYNTQHTQQEALQIIHQS